MSFERTIQLIGSSCFERLQASHVLLVGVGGVGGWCAEALIRSGLGHLTIIDMDTIAESNLNRQLVATSANIGLHKADEMRLRLLSINPEADITGICAKYTADGFLDNGSEKQSIDLSRYDYIIDAIDTLDCKSRLIHDATNAVRADGTQPVFFSSMGAGRKVHTEQIRVAEFRKVEGCPLARALRNRMKKSGLQPGHKFLCVYSPELSGERGTVAPIVGIFGMHLAGCVLNDLLH